ncbi:hypothetical protein K2173_014399 [Erythroxylum novogranatense]|uniref:KIB1-4 beta-propeller domain-containing protein n=1 Tax=Erythroxylum novogranatense TaxID=1862640 RepID=A0AAV8S513_9ROSI|nr:hypothetical protein K2173_014399 [Erythroxylum novogranatense]
MKNSNRCWSNLPLELLNIIEDEIVVCTDKLRFSCVCKIWQSMAEIPNQNEIPWLVVPNYRSNTISSSYGLHNLLNNKFYSIDLEEVKGKLFKGSSHGWLVVVDRKSTTINLINPITKAQVQLPPRHKFPDVMRYQSGEDEDLIYWDFRAQQISTGSSSNANYDLLHRVILSSNPSSNNYIVASTYNQYSELAFCRRGDTEWITIDDETNYDDIIFHNEELYGFSSWMNLSIFDVSSWIPKLREVIPFPKGNYGYFWSYLVEHCGEILLILRRLKWDETRQREITRYFNVYKLHRSNKSWLELSDIEGGLVFVGLNSSFSISSVNLPTGWRGNKIYFTDNLDFLEEGVRGGCDFGMYDMVEKDIYRFENYTSNKLIWPPPIWVTLNSS